MDIQKMRAWAESEAGEAYFQGLRDKQALQEARYLRFEKWLEDNDFDKLIYRLILEHDDDYIDKCYHNGYMPMPNNKLGFVIDYVFENLASINVTELDCDFANDIRFFKGYYFQMIHGQGVITRIYNKDDMRKLLQL